MKHLIICEGWIGDILFTASIAEHLKKMDQSCYVAIWIPLIQPKKVLEQNPYIDEVVFGFDKSSVIPHFDVAYQMPVLRQDIPATHQYQLAAGISTENLTLPFNVYTIPDIDEKINIDVEKMRADGYYKPIVGFQGNWDERSMIYTSEEYESGEYKGTYRDIPRILNEISKYVTLVQVGFPKEINQFHPAAHNDNVFAEQASLIKFCDFVIGAEGGITNLAASVRCKCIITTEHMWRMFGPHGIMSQYDKLAMGPATYYPMDGHVHLDPFITDDDLIQRIIKLTDK